MRVRRLIRERSEFDYHSDLAAALKKVLGSGLATNGIDFTDIRNNYSVDGGFADIVVFAKVIEMKRKGKKDM